MKWHLAEVERPEESCKVVVACGKHDVYNVTDVRYSKKHDSFNSDDDYDEEQNAKYAFPDVVAWAYESALNAEIELVKDAAR